MPGRPSRAVVAVIEQHVMCCRSPVVVVSTLPEPTAEPRSGSSRTSRYGRSGALSDALSAASRDQQIYRRCGGQALKPKLALCSQEALSSCSPQNYIDIKYSFAMSTTHHRCRRPEPPLSSQSQVVRFTTIMACFVRDPDVHLLDTTARGH